MTANTDIVPSLQTSRLNERIVVRRNQGHAVIEPDWIVNVATVESMPIPGRSRHWQERPLISINHFSPRLRNDDGVRSSRGPLTPKILGLEVTTSSEP